LLPVDFGIFFAHCNRTACGIFRRPSLNYRVSPDQPPGSKTGRRQVKNEVFLQRK
jgi:hypothetical protein